MVTKLFAGFQTSFMVFLAENFLYKYRYFYIVENSEIITLADL